MKESRYNYFKQYSDGCMIVNGRTCAALLVDTRKYPQAKNWTSKKRLFDGDSRASDVSEEGRSQPLMDQLLQLGFIIPDETDEIADLKQKHQNHVHNKQVLNIHVNPTLDCNFSCWYCYENHIEDSVMGPQTQERLVSFVRKQIRTAQVKGVHISYFGGEPFLRYREVIVPLNRQLEELCALYKVELSYSATTNGYLLTEFCSDMQSDLSNRAFLWKSFQITLDGSEVHHNELRKLKADNSVSYHRIMTNLLRILSTGKMDIHLRINYSNANVDGVFDILKDIPSHLRTRLAVSLHRIWQTRDEEDILDITEIYERLSTEGFRMDAQRLILGKREVCYADRYSQLLVNFDGNVFKCTARDFEPSTRLGYLDKNGTLVFEQDRWSRRMEASVWNIPRCTQCYLLPLCMGACSQLLFESEQEDVPCVLSNKKKELSVFMDQMIERMRMKYSEAGNCLAKQTQTT